jgi:hypothetical protein
VRSAGAVIEQPPESRTLTLPVGQMLTLDQVSSGSSPECSSPSVVFGVRYAQRFPTNVASALTADRGGSGRGGGVLSMMTPYTAELWLVHSVPGKPDTVVPMTVAVTSGIANFDFAAVQAPILGGNLTVHIDGQLRLLVTASPEPTLVFQAKRTASFVPSNRPPRDPRGPEPEGRATVAVRLRLRPAKGTN